jgi:hypothetical protein
MEDAIEGRRAILETGREERRNTLVRQQTKQMQRLELMERVAIAVGDLLSARQTELSPVEIIIVSRLEGVSDIKLSADSRGQISTCPWLTSIDDDIPF